MKKNIRRITTIVIGIALCAALSITVLVSIPALAGGESPSINDSGQTYGSAMHAYSFETEPDLIRAIGTCGTEGYVYAEDLHGPMPSTPDEAVAIMEQYYTGSRSIPLYANDGMTVIGKFVIHPPSAVLYD